MHVSEQNFAIHEVITAVPLKLPKHLQLSYNCNKQPFIVSTVQKAPYFQILYAWEPRRIQAVS